MRWPSANSVSNAREDFPDPDSPVITTNLFLGIATLRFLRLLTLARFIIIYSLGSRVSRWSSFINTAKSFTFCCQFRFHRSHLKGKRYKQQHHPEGWCSFVLIFLLR